MTVDRTAAALPASLLLNIVHDGSSGLQHVLFEAKLDCFHTCLYSKPVWNENIDSISSRPHKLSTHGATGGWAWEELRLRLGHGGGIHLAFRRCWGVWDGFKSKWVCCGMERQKNLLSCWRCTILWGTILGTLLIGKGAGLSYPRCSKKVRLSLIFFTSCTFLVCSLYCVTGLNSKKDVNGVRKGIGEGGFCEDHVVAWWGGRLSGGVGDGAGAMDGGTVGWQAGLVSGFSGSASARSDRRVLILDCLVCCRPRSRIFSSERKDQEYVSSTSIVFLGAVNLSCSLYIYLSEPESVVICSVEDVFVSLSVWSDLCWKSAGRVLKAAGWLPGFLA